MKNIIISSVVIALGAATVGLGTKVYMDSKSHIVAESSAASAMVPESTPIVVERPRIIRSIAQYEVKKVPYKKCGMVNQTQQVENKNKDGTVGGVVGGTTGAVAGGVIGKQIGGNTAGTLIGGAVGLIGGAIAGNEIQKAKQPNTVTQVHQVEQCTQEFRNVKQLTGYKVEYSYHGKISSVLLGERPSGKYLPLSDMGE